MVCMNLQLIQGLYAHLIKVRYCLYIIDYCIALIHQLGVARNFRQFHATCFRYT